MLQNIRHGTTSTANFRVCNALNSNYKLNRYSISRCDQYLFSTSTSSPTTIDESTKHYNHSNQNPKQIRVAIVGGGASGLSAALHLAPLVERGIIAKPIDLYDDNGKDENVDLQSPGSGAIGREIGVGIWNTALKPFLSSTHGGGGEPRKSHSHLIENLQLMGKWVGKVGYRTPNGSWLARSCLNYENALTLSSTPDFNEKKQSSSSTTTTNNKTPCQEDPSLLFIREKSFLKALRDAVLEEEMTAGTIQTHYADNKSKICTRVEDIVTSSQAFGSSGQLLFSDGSVSSASSPYNLIIASDGIHSTLRSKYAGHSHLDRHWKQTQFNSSKFVAKNSHKWQQYGNIEANAIEDRLYTVFRGNSPLSDEEVGLDGMNFQTWGEGESMRFAVVGMSYPDDSNPSNKDCKEIDKRIEKQVWFATTSDPTISNTKDADRRKDLLKKAFKSWHEPIYNLIDSTPANEILMEKAVAHKHSVKPVFNTDEIKRYLRNDYDDKSHSKNDIPDTNYKGNGPFIVFSGDALMTIDPVLAQGFTMSMEAAADLARTIETCFTKDENTNKENIMIDFEQLRQELELRHNRRHGRIICLLRATELVQLLAQPGTGTPFGFLSTYFIRPMMKVTPNFLKNYIFTYIMKYSLGMHGKYSLADSRKQ